MASQYVYTLACGKQVMVMAEEVVEGCAAAAGVGEDARGTSRARRAACNTAAKNGRHAFQRFAQALEKQGKPTEYTREKLLEKVERASLLGQMEQQTEILAALSTAQRAKYVLPAKSTAAERRAKRMAGNTKGMESAQEPAQEETDTGGYWKRKYEELRAETDEVIKQLNADLAAEVRMRTVAEEREQLMMYGSAEPAKAATQARGDSGDSNSGSSSEDDTGSDGGDDAGSEQNQDQT